MPSDLEAVLFDLDGVLVDSRDAIAGSINHALVHHGLAAVEATRLHGFIGATLPEVFVDLLAEQGRDGRLSTSCLNRYREHYATASLEETFLYDGIDDVVETLARRHRLAVATTKPAEYARPILETVGLLDRFETVVGSPLEATKGEEKRVTIGRTLEALGVSRAAMVGDRRFDVVGARAHGLFPIGVTWGAGTEAELVEAGAAALARRPGDLLALLDAGP